MTPAVLVLLKLLSRLPLGVLYKLSDLLAWVLHKVVRYRVDVVRANLQLSFPDKGKDELGEIESAYFRHLADIILETAKLWRMSKHALQNHITFLQPDLLPDLLKSGKSIVIMMGHSGNWEWAGCVTASNYPFAVLPVYRKIKNKDFNQYFKILRSRFGAIPVLDKEAFSLISVNTAPHVVALLADQTPSGKKGLWLQFLNQSTPFYRGTEVMVKRLGHQVVFAQVRKMGRGQYVIHLEKPELNDTSGNATTLAFAAFLEREIKLQPYNWLWSHKRWKHKSNDDAIWID